MQHIATEGLARLMDEAPAPAESAHLESCAECRDELAALVAHREALRSLPDHPAPARGWQTLQSRLEAEGLIRPPARVASLRWLRPLTQIAAALALFVAGGLAGAAWTDGRTAPVPAAFRADGPVAGGALVVAPEPALEAAAEALRRHEAAYFDALTRYAELFDGPSQLDPLERLAALEGIVLTTRAALEQSPADPVINGYHLSALSQREALLRQLARPRDHSSGAHLVNADDPWF
jgi:hypothetical protein